MITIYDRVTAQCQTLNQLNAVHIALEVSMTPLEMLRLWSEVQDGQPYWTVGPVANTALPREKFKEAAQNWLNKLKGFHEMIGKPEPEPFERRELMKSVHLFSDGKPPDGKTLLLCLNGAGHMPMMPTGTFLQAIDARKVVVATLRDYRKTGYRAGIEGIGDTLQEVWAALPRLFHFEAYRRVTTIGISGGGLPAVMTAVALGLDAVVSAGGNSPIDPRWGLSDGSTGADFIKALKGPKLPEKIVAIHGSHAEPDKKAADDLAAILPAETIPIYMPGYEWGHNALYPMLVQGTLPGFLEEHLGLGLR